MTPGTKLGPYEIIAPIGAGGMGEVYRARDTRLGREVAIKFSKEQFSERFEREARAVAALNHPNICHLYDVGPNYLVMELVEGEPVKGPLPLQKALEYAGQILDALVLNATFPPRYPLFIVFGGRAMGLCSTIVLLGGLPVCSWCMVLLLSRCFPDLPCEMSRRSSSPAYRENPTGAPRP
jgi:hypothetical protein